MANVHTGSSKIMLVPALVPTAKSGPTIHMSACIKTRMLAALGR